MSASRIKDIASIQKLGHIEFRTADREWVRDFYVNLIGTADAMGRSAASPLVRRTFDGAAMKETKPPLLPAVPTYVLD